MEEKFLSRKNTWGRRQALLCCTFTRTGSSVAAADSSCRIELTCKASNSGRRRTSKPVLLVSAATATPTPPRLPVTDAAPPGPKQLEEE